MSGGSRINESERSKSFFGSAGASPSRAIEIADLKGERPREPLSATPEGIAHPTSEANARIRGPGCRVWRLQIRELRVDIPWMDSRLTFAARQGATFHVSPLKMKARRLGLANADSLVALAVQRGCRHYLPYVQSMNASAPRVTRAEFPDEELAVALLLGSWPHEPVMVRAAAQLAGAPSIRPDELALLAERERCVPALRHIAQAGRQTEPENGFWEELLRLLPPAPPPRPGSMPHPSRFRSETGIVNPRRQDMPRVLWLRPQKGA